MHLDNIDRSVRCELLTLSQFLKLKYELYENPIKQQFHPISKVSKILLSHCLEVKPNKLFHIGLNNPCIYNNTKCNTYLACFKWGAEAIMIVTMCKIAERALTSQDQKTTRKTEQ